MARTRSLAPDARTRSATAVDRPVGFRASPPMSAWQLTPLAVNQDGESNNQVDRQWFVKYSEQRGAGEYFTGLKLLPPIAVNIEALLHDVRICIRTHVPIVNVYINAKSLQQPAATQHSLKTFLVQTHEKLAELSDRTQSNHPYIVSPENVSR